jgi:hypothetical protein
VTAVTSSRAVTSVICVSDLLSYIFTVNIIRDTCAHVRRPAVAAGRHYMQDDGPSNSSASIADGCVITGDCDDSQLFGASRKHL